MRFYHAVSSSIDFHSAKVFLEDLCAGGYLTPREGRLVLASLSDTALSAMSREDRDFLRAEIFKTVLLQRLSEREGEE